MKPTAITAVLTVALLAGCGQTADGPAAPEASTAHVGQLGASQAFAAATALAEATGVTDLGNATDNTGGCSGAQTNNCRALVTTDTVSIYQFDDEATAATWVDRMSSVGPWVQVGAWALAWTARHQALTSKERRRELVDAMKTWVATQPG